MAAGSLSVQTSELSAGLGAVLAPTVRAGSRHGLPSLSRERLFLTQASIGYRSGFKQ